MPVCETHPSRAHRTRYHTVAHAPCQLGRANEGREHSRPTTLDSEGVHPLEAAEKVGAGLHKESPHLSTCPAPYRSPPPLTAVACALRSAPTSSCWLHSNSRVMCVARLVIPPGRRSHTLDGLSWDAAWKGQEEEEEEEDRRISKTARVPSERRRAIYSMSALGGRGELRGRLAAIVTSMYSWVRGRAGAAAIVPRSSSAASTKEGATQTMRSSERAGRAGGRSRSSAYENGSHTSRRRTPHQQREEPSTRDTPGPAIRNRVLRWKAERCLSTAVQLRCEMWHSDAAPGS